MNGTITFESQNNESLSKLIYTHNQKLSFGLSVSAYRLVKYGRFDLPGGFLPEGGRPGLKYGISRNIREIWQPYLYPPVSARPT